MACSRANFTFTFYCSRDPLLITLRKNDVTMVPVLTKVLYHSNVPFEMLLAAARLLSTEVVVLRAKMWH